MHRIRTALGSLCFAGCLLAQAPDVRELQSPVDYEVLLDATAAQVTQVVNSGFRIVDLEVRTSTPTFTAKLVRNSGAYAAGWWWYFDLTATQVGNFLTQNQARLIDLEPYDNGSGALRFACVMVDNTGVNAKNWWWFFNTNPTAIGNELAARNARLVDLDEYRVGTTTYHSAVMIANTGSDARGWWWYTNTTPSQIGTLLDQNQARIYDLVRRQNGNYDVVMIRDVQPKTWWWWTGLTAAQVTSVLANHGARAIDIETYTVTAGSLVLRRFDVVSLNNSNALTTTIGAAMRTRTVGTVGAWLDDFGTVSTAPKLVDLNGQTRFEPASTMKTLHHVHAMRQVNLGNIALSTTVQMFTGIDGSCPLDTNPINQTLSSTLRQMMEDSSNQATQAITARFGQSAINGTAAAIGMADTSLNHRIGCSAPALTNPNQITLRDLSTLHRRVANGYLGTFRDTFYDLMLNNLAELGLASIIAQEATSLGLSTATRSTFQSMTRMAHKGGNYRWPSAPLFHRAEFGWLSLPFVVGTTIVDREYGFGAFVNDATVDADAEAAIYTDAIPAVLRDRVRAALLTWVGAQATITSFGTGCGAPNAFTQTNSGLPRLDSTVSYRSQSGFANALAVLVFGYSSTSWNSTALPASLVPYGSAAGCMARIDAVATEAVVSNSVGSAAFSLRVPNRTSLIGYELLTQWYSFGSQPFLTSNAMRSVVGL